ncbi:MAG: N-acetylmuramoyl-L-alanine amidase [Ruminococcaceae bacterium]|nr:N-acetylmuramoyl-L-alanine amidase [Oscillospiraceae bacterium]
MAGKRLQKRRKKKGMALLISRLLRLGLLVVLLACAGLATFGIKACADYFRDMSAGVADQSQQPQIGGEEEIHPPEEPSVFAGFSVSGVVTVDPGHGGSDPGCGEEGALEKDIVLPISLMLRDMLEEAGITVIMTRQQDEHISLDDRAEIANNAGSDLFVSIHCNSYEGEARGMDVYYHKSEPAKELAQAVLDQAAALGIRTREVQKNNYQVLWDTDMPAVLVETGFLTNPEECALLQQEEYQEKIAQAAALAVLNALSGGTIHGT